MRLTVCRDCCCGTTRKHPELDHDEQLRRLREIAEEHGARVTVSDCLDVCAQSNVVVVQRPGGGKPVWLGFVLGEAVLGDLAKWLAAGGPGRAPLPETLELHRISPPVREGSR
ncbi:(2Fe-2S) ferredoxin domain-containing protein [Crossiella sp. SN42]|uniref:(2Fe-2S) ferredoxin domain-containing protein n=1 Tax=Crossiella sp. SN42 TaxID=2944808 RepID=UPI00207C17B0|nr:(2Fe-2S) ferredoxin domain-containing protein [Crossiella sp. SN42]MCO1577619.1 (2Fe-2S) ferredoxin domain-containing protein [Crossiella sp. SN42]